MTDVLTDPGMVVLLGVAFMLALVRFAWVDRD